METPPFVAPDKKFLVAYFDPVNIRPGDITGLIRDSFLMPEMDYVWALSDEERPPDDPNIWAVPYARTRYTYEFRVSGETTRCGYEHSMTRSLLLIKGVPRPGDTLTHLHDSAGYCTVLLQTNSPLSGWDEKTGTLREGSLVGGHICFIDVASNE
ncbi:MAG: hypothetical protein WC700_07795 [Gemmatimonadaceae bacterium]|jgi:hypothetical protein